LVIVLGHRARMRRDADGWAITFDEPAYGTFRTTGLASVALRAAEDYVRRIDRDREIDDGEESQSSRSARGAPPEFWVTATGLLHRIAEAAVEDTRARYELGRLVHHLRYDCSDAVSARILARLGHSLGLTPGTLRHYARVSAVIGPIEFDQYMHLRRPHGMPLRWSHIEELSEARNVDVRRRFAEEPSVLRFPSGCFAHVSERPPVRNLKRHSGAIDARSPTAR
jgi:hypothetical protein